MNGCDRSRGRRPALDPDPASQSGGVQGRFRVEKPQRKAQQRPQIKSLTAREFDMGTPHGALGVRVDLAGPILLISTQN